MFDWAKNIFGGGGATNQQVQVATNNQVAGGQGYGQQASTQAGTTYQPVVPGGGNTGYGGGQGGGFFSQGGGASLLLGGLQTVGSLWNAYQQQKLAKESLNFQKDAFETNLKNSTQTYNTALEDRIRNRYDFSADHTQADADKYVDKHKL